MMYCVNCDYHVCVDEVRARKCHNCGKDPAHEQATATNNSLCECGKPSVKKKDGEFIGCCDDCLPF